jgi:tetratricopeptide (TPR) repeat protein
MQGKFDEGLPLWHEVVDVLNQLEAGEASSGLGGMKFIRAMAYIVNEHPDADKVVDEMFADETRIHGKYSAQNLSWWFGLVQRYLEVGNVDRAIELQLDAVDQAREIAMSEGKDRLDLYKMQLELANMYEDAERFDEGIDLLSELVPSLEERVGLYDRHVIVAKMILAKSKFKTDHTEESILMMAALHISLSDELGVWDSMTKVVETQWINMLIDLERWDEVDEKMEKRFTQRTDDANLLLKLAENIIQNSHMEYKERYSDLALKAAQRAVSIKGELASTATSVLAQVHFVRGEFEEASNWYAKSIAFADEDNEDIEMYRTKLQEVITKLEGTVEE